MGTQVQLPSVQLDSVREDLFDATQGTVLSANVEPFALADGQTLTVAVDGGGAQLVTFNGVDFDDIATATADEVAAVITNALTGAVATVESGAVRITSDAFGTGSTVEVTGGTGAAALAFPAGVQAGTDATDVTRLINRIPEPDESGVPIDGDVQVEVHDTTGAVTLNAIQVYVDGALAYDGGGGGFQAGFTGTDSSVDANTRRVVIDPDVDFPGDYEVTVRVVVASPPASTAIDSTYSFLTADVIAPTVASAVAQEKMVVRVTFDEAVTQVSPSASNDALNPSNYLFLRNDVPSVSVVPEEVVPVDAQSVDITTDITLSFGRSYTVQVLNVEDLLGNVVVAPNNEATFDAFTPSAPAERRFSLIEFIPQLNRSEDATGDLSLFVAILQDVTDVLLCLVDRWSDILDPDIAAERYLDAMLCDLGNPFSFVELTEADKRRLIRTLIDIYKSKGTEQGIIDVINFFLGVLVSIETFTGEGWELASSDSPTLDGQSPPVDPPNSELSASGVEAPGAMALGPGERRLLYSFIVVSPVNLTDEQRSRIRQIVDLMKPAHTHLLGIAEPATAPAEIDHLELAFSELGNGTPGTWTLH